MKRTESTPKTLHREIVHPSFLLQVSMLLWYVKAVHVCTNPQVGVSGKPSESNYMIIRKRSGRKVVVVGGGRKV
jgi:hypothetical protein